MKFSVGYQLNELLKKSILAHLDRIDELYFPWGDFTTGRGVGEAEENKAADLKDYAASGLKMNWLLNGNCYGRRSQSRKFFQTLGDTAENLQTRFQLKAITTTSPLIAKFIKMNFKELEVRASVNMEIGTIEGVEYLLEQFDSFYLKREYNYDLTKMKRLSKYCHEHGKKLYLLANSGCLNFCSARTFHDNLVSHQHEIAEMDNAFEFKGLCHEFLKDAGKRVVLLRRMNFIRPEDVPLYEPYCDGMKLATRTNRNPAAVVAAYTNGVWGGNVLDLTEPSHSGNCYPQIIANDRIPADYAEHRLGCNKDCENCNYCKNIQKEATINLTMEGIVKC